MASATWVSNPWVWRIAFKRYQHATGVDWVGHCASDEQASAKERPILFRGEMVRAILEGRKTQTRRVAWQQPEHIEHIDSREALKRFGKVGDRLWVRETWAPMRIDGRDLVAYQATCERSEFDYVNPLGGIQRMRVGRWKPSIHMPRWACRLVLEVTDVRVERLQDISEADAKAEGVDADDKSSAWANFQALWRRIHD